MGTYKALSTRRALCIQPLTVVLFALLSASPGSAVENPAPPAKPPVTIDQSATQMPDAYKLNMLIRTTLIALNQANQTGNYSVLRDLGTPQFQSLNSDARLAEIFAALRKPEARSLAARLFRSEAHSRAGDAAGRPTEVDRLHPYRSAADPVRHGI